MKKYLFTLIALCLTLPSFAQTFKQRVETAQKISLKPAGQQYDTSLIPYIKSALDTCIPDKKPTPDDKSFVLVANVSPYGILLDIDVKPLNKLSKCMKQNFGLPSLPVPPKTKNKEGYPIVISVTMRK